MGWPSQLCEASSQAVRKMTRVGAGLKELRPVSAFQRFHSRQAFGAANAELLRNYLKLAPPFETSGSERQRDMFRSIANE